MGGGGVKRQGRFWRERRYRLRIDSVERNNMNSDFSLFRCQAFEHNDALGHFRSSTRRHVMLASCRYTWFLLPCRLIHLSRLLSQSYSAVLVFSISPHSSTPNISSFCRGFEVCEGTTAMGIFAVYFQNRRTESHALWRMSFLGRKESVKQKSWRSQATTFGKKTCPCSVDIF